MTHVSLGFVLQKSFRVNGGHAAGAGGGDRLAVNVILHVAAGEDARNVGLGAVVGENVSARV